MKKTSFYYALFLALLIPSAVFACDGCNPDASPWYKHLPNQTLAYIAQEFDKTAPAGGMNWDGDAEDWFSNAAQFDWVEKTAPKDAQTGAMILLKNANNEVSIGIVCQVAAGHIVYKAPDKNGTFVQASIDLDTLDKQFHLIGYIYPKKVDRAKQKRLILN